MAEPQEEDIDTFDILCSWKTNSTRFPIVSQLARDILAILVSTVASKSAFSTGGRILDPFCSSLSPNMVEALICTENWLRSSSQIHLRDQMDEIEQIESGIIPLVLKNCLYFCCFEYDNHKLSYNL